MRKKEIELKKDTVRINPLTSTKLEGFDYIGYTDGACKKIRNEKIGSAAYVLYNDK